MSELAIIKVIISAEHIENLDESSKVHTTTRDGRAGGRVVKVHILADGVMSCSER